MDLIKDVLDNQLVDRKDRKIGKVDGIVVELRDGLPPRLLRIEVGPSTVARRMHPRFGAWVAARLHRWDKIRTEPITIPWVAIQEIGINVKLDRDAAMTTTMAWENWLSDHIIRRIPGGA
jgi:hypothetical protein